MLHTMPIPRTFPSVVGISLIAACLVAFPVTPANSASVHSVSKSDPVTVSIPLQTIQTPGKSGQNAIVRIKVGESRPIKVMVDTGIIGLHLWSAAPRGAQMTTQGFSGRVSGKQISGLIGSAPLTLGGVTTTTPQTFALITTDSSYIDKWKKRGVMGIIGLGVGSGNLTNPLMSMPGELARGWSLHFERTNSRLTDRSSALVLGAQAPADAQMHFALPSAGVDVLGSPVWNDHAADGCWQFDEGPEHCVPTWFDSGFALMRVKGRAFADLPTTPSQRLRTGTLVELAAGSSAFFGYRFLAGRQGSRNLVKVIPRGSPVVNTGNSVYFDYTVTYRVDTGDIYLSEKGTP